MHDANTGNTNVLMPNPFNAIRTPYSQIPAACLVHLVSTCLMMQLEACLLVS